MKSRKLDVNKITDLIALKFLADEGSISVLKLHKLLYYVEAWHIAIFNTKLFDEDFEAWVHGPVCRKVFERFKFKLKKFMYSPVTLDDLDILQADNIDDYKNINYHVESVLDAYGKLSGPQLEELTHAELPWQEARAGLRPSQPCTNIISKESMRDYYKQQLIA